MNSVKVYANLALRDRQDKYLRLIVESTQEAITGIKDMIWVLDDTTSNIDHLLQRVERFGIPLYEANNIQYAKQVSYEAKEYKLGHEEKRSLYMILKEAANNTVKYSGADIFEINVGLKKAKLFIEIKDNGKGFDKEIKSEGNGLRNMRHRAKEINYTIDIKTEKGNGVAISLQKV